jgi:quercetin dioxygenase-like cupin family protein
MLNITKGIKPEFTDARGDIMPILDDGTTNIRSVLIINSKKGSIRANHYHKEDSHYCYMVSGKMEYFEKPIDAPDSEIETAIVEAGDMVYSPPMVVHAMRFLEDTTWIVLATKSRKDGAYEDDTVRVKFI